MINLFCKNIHYGIIADIHPISIYVASYSETGGILSVYYSDDTEQEYEFNTSTMTIEGPGTISIEEGHLAGNDAFAPGAFHICYFEYGATLISNYLPYLVQLDQITSPTPQSRELYFSFEEGFEYEDYTKLIIQVSSGGGMGDLEVNEVYLEKENVRTSVTEVFLRDWLVSEFFCLCEVTDRSLSYQGYISGIYECYVFDSDLYIEIENLKYIPDDSRGAYNVGGTIFYIDSSVSQWAYRFYNEYGVPGVTPSVGTDCTGWTYDIIGTPAKDRYYVYNPDTVFSGRTGTVSDPYISWTYFDESPDIIATYETEELPAYVSGYGRVFENLNITGTAVGTGKTNTSSIMSIERDVTIGGVTSNTHAYVQGPQISGTRSYDSSTYAETVWYICDNFNKGSYSKKNNTTGCSDWYVPSKDEQSRLAEHFSSLDSYSSFIGTEESYSWSSSCSDGVAWSTTSGNIDGYSWGLNAYGSGVYYPNSMGESKFYNGKHYRSNGHLMCLFLIRSF